MANLLTALRIVLIAPIALCFLIGNTSALQWTATVLFVIAGITDFLDGYIARKNNTVSPLGAALDPIADKLLTSAVLLLLVSNGSLYGLHLIPALAILLREFLVSGLREALAGRLSLPVTFIAKLKTTIQFIALPCLLTPLQALQQLGLLALWVAALLTVTTGYGYVSKAIAGLRSYPHKSRHFGVRRTPDD